MKCVVGNIHDEIPIAAEKIANKINLDETYLAFDLWVCPDAWPYMPDTKAGRAGFFFEVTGFPEWKKTFDERS